MDELKKNTPRLSKLKKENPFGTPDKYFDDFSARLKIKLEAEKKIIPIKQNLIIRFLKPAIGIAASFAIIFLLANLPIKNFLSQKVANSSVETEFSEADYLRAMEGIDENSVYSLIEETDEGIEFSDEDLLSYASANTSEYELFMDLNNN
ncbi:MAG: hypothetical protein KAH68_06235 [Draconibacterium sp.]|nr:hypothetical protein [Draconibacterium sp.]